MTQAITSENLAMKDSDKRPTETETILMALVSPVCHVHYLLVWR